MVTHFIYFVLLSFLLFLKKYCLIFKKNVPFYKFLFHAVPSYCSIFSVLRVILYIVLFAISRTILCLLTVFVGYTCLHSICSILLSSPTVVKVVAAYIQYVL